jgi:hypothetical protein
MRRSGLGGHAAWAGGFRARSADSRLLAVGFFYAMRANRGVSPCGASDFFTENPNAFGWMYKFPL